MSSWNGTKIGLRVNDSEEELAQEFLMLLGLKLTDDMDEEIGELSDLEDYTVVGTVQDDLLGIMPSLESKFAAYQNQFYGSNDIETDETGNGIQLDDLFLAVKNLFPRSGMYLAHEDGNSVSDTYYRYEVIYNADRKTELNCFYSYGDGINTDTDDPAEEGLEETEEKLKAKKPDKAIIDLLIKKAESEGYNELVQRLQGKPANPAEQTKKKESVKRIPGLKIVKGIVIEYTGKETQLEIPEGVTEIAAEAFMFSTKLTKITLPDTLERIGEKAFNDCWELMEIKIPENVKYIGASAFLHCKKLKEILIPAHIEKIEEQAFKYCEELQKISLPPELNDIGDDAFSYCKKLNGVILPDSIINIGRYAFYNCEQLTDIVLPMNLTQIGKYAFSKCTSLMKVTVPGTLRQTIEDNYVFNNCEELTDIQYI